MIDSLAFTTNEDGRLVYADRNSFNYDSWVPTLAGVYRAKTAGEQRKALADTVIGMACSNRGLRQLPNDRYRYLAYDIEARFRTAEPFLDDQALKFIAIGGVARIGYQTPDLERPQPAFAVIDTQKGYHHVLRTPAEELNGTDTALGQEATLSFMRVLDGQYPGFDLPLKLREELDLAATPR